MVLVAVGPGTTTEHDHRLASLIAWCIRTVSSSVITGVMQFTCITGTFLLTAATAYSILSQAKVTWAAGPPQGSGMVACRGRHGVVTKHRRDSEHRSTTVYDP